MFILKTLKNAPTCFDHHSDHLQGTCMFLFKVTDLTNFRISNFKKEHNKLPEGDLNDDRNMLERF